MQLHCLLPPWPQVVDFFFNDKVLPQAQAPTILLLAEVWVGQLGGGRGLQTAQRWGGGQCTCLLQVSIGGQGMRGALPWGLGGVGMLA